MTLTFAVAGCGSFGTKRIQALKNIPNAVLVATIDPKHKESPEHLNSFDELLRTSKPDCVIISTPNRFHYPLVKQALEKGLHVLCEKPISLTLAQAAHLEKIAKDNGLCLKVGTNHRFFSGVQETKRILQNQELGTIKSIHASIGNDGSRLKDSWFWDPDIAGGGVLLDMGHHLVDLLFFLGFEPTPISLQVSNETWKAKVEDYASASLRSHHINIDLEASRNRCAGYLTLTITGSRGSLTLDIGEKETLTIKTQKNKHTLDLSSLPKDSITQDIKSFIDHITQGTKAPTGRETLKTILNLYQLQK